MLHEDLVCVGHSSMQLTSSDRMCEHNSPAKVGKVSMVGLRKASMDRGTEESLLTCSQAQKCYKRSHWIFTFGFAASVASIQGAEHAPQFFCTLNNVSMTCRGAISQSMIIDPVKC